MSEPSDPPFETPAFLVGVAYWKLEKFEGDPPQPGEDKQPIEIIEGGDGRPTVRHVFGKTPAERYSEAVEDLHATD